MGWTGALFDASLYAYFLAAVAFAAWFLRDSGGSRRLWRAGAALLALGGVSQVVFLAARGVLAGRPPMANLFETLVFTAACAALGFLAAARKGAWRPLAPLAALGAFAATLAASLARPEGIEPLLPALRSSFWLTFHVGFCMVSYAAFVLAYAATLASLAKSPRHRPWAGLVIAMSLALVLVLVALAAARGLLPESRRAVALAAAGATVMLGVLLWPLLGWLSARLDIADRLPDEAALENAAYRAVAFGFPFLTLGIATGAWWAAQAWGRYWGWDDKEVAALVTWLVFAAYLHARLGTGERRRHLAAWVAVAGFWSVLFTYFGVSYLLGGLHAYV